MSGVMTSISTVATEYQYVTFTVDSLFFGIAVDQVQEILRYQPMTRVPLAPGYVRGLMNLRGQIITTVDMRALLELPLRDDDSKSMMVVINTQEETLAILVDSVGDVLELTSNSYETIPRTIPEQIRDKVGGVHKLDDSLMLILNLNACFEAESSNN